LVVITKAPFAALTPYRAVAAPPLRTVIDSISSGFKSIERLEVVTPPTPPDPPPEIIGIPLTTNKGWLLPVIEALPRIVIKVEAPASPAELIIETPEVRPAKLFTISAFGLPERMSLLTV
jgi:hypothetical protein